MQYLQVLSILWNDKLFVMHIQKFWNITPHEDQHFDLLCWVIAEVFRIHFDGRNWT